VKFGLLVMSVVAGLAVLSAQDKAEWFGLGINAYQKGNYGEAAVNFTRAIEMDSLNHIFWFNRATCFVKMRDYDKAIFDLQRTITLDPMSANAYMQLAVVLAETRRHENAILAVSKAIELDSTLPKTHYLRGRLYLSTGDTVAACSDLRISSERGDPAARSLLKETCEP